MRAAENKKAPDRIERPISGAAVWPRGPRKHPNPPKADVPPYGQGARVAYPSAYDFQGRTRAMLAAVNNRVSRWTLRDWIAGRYRAPLWAKQILADELRQQIAARQHVLALLEADMDEKSDPLIGEVRNSG